VGRKIAFHEDPTWVKWQNQPKSTQITLNYLGVANWCGVLG